MEIICKSDFRDLRIYFNGLIHLHINKETYIGIQSWLEGSKYRNYFIEIIFKDTTILMGYDNRQRWEDILKLIDENI